MSDEPEYRCWRRECLLRIWIWLNWFSYLHIHISPVDFLAYAQLISWTADMSKTPELKDSITSGYLSAILKSYQLRTQLKQRRLPAHRLTSFHREYLNCGFLEWVYQRTSFDRFIRYEIPTDHASSFKNSEKTSETHTMYQHRRRFCTKGISLQTYVEVKSRSRSRALRCTRFAFMLIHPHHNVGLAVVQITLSYADNYEKSATVSSTCTSEPCKHILVYSWLYSGTTDKPQFPYLKTHNSSTVVFLAYSYTTSKVSISILNEDHVTVVMNAILGPLKRLGWKVESRQQFRCESRLFLSFRFEIRAIRIWHLIFFPALPIW